MDSICDNLTAMDGDPELRLVLWDYCLEHNLCLSDFVPYTSTLMSGVADSETIDNNWQMIRSSRWIIGRSRGGDGHHLISDSNAYARSYSLNTTRSFRYIIIEISQSGCGRFTVV